MMKKRDLTLDNSVSFTVRIMLFLIAIITTQLSIVSSCPEVCLDVFQSQRFFGQVHPVATEHSLEFFYHSIINNNNEIYQNDIFSFQKKKNVVPLLLPEESLFIIHQNQEICDLGFIIIHDSIEDSLSATGGQVQMRLGSNVQDSIVDQNNNPFSMIYDEETDETEIYFEWGGQGDLKSDFQIDGLTGGWDPSDRSCIEVSSKFIIGIDHWRFVTSEAMDPSEYFYLDKDETLQVCMGTCGQTPSSTSTKASIFRSFSQASKKLVVYAGPLETDVRETLEFLGRNAQENGIGALSGWIWPTANISGTVHYHPFDRLVKDPDDDYAQSVIVQSIQDAWSRSDHGVIIGGYEFGMIGSNPFSDYDPEMALQKVVNALNISNDDVAVILTYRSPREDHWLALFEGDFEKDQYKDFICSNSDEDKRWEWLDSIMNPFKVASVYQKGGYNVAVVDEEGTVNAGLDVPNAIAFCIFHGVNCENGWRQDDDDNFQQNSLVAMPIPSLQKAQTDDLEKLFLARDCYYKYMLQDKHGFEIINRHITWSTCSRQHIPFYKQFIDTDYLLNAIQSQFESCAEERIEVSTILQEKSVLSAINNKLIVYAGPLETRGIPITKFFAHHASNSEEYEHSSGLNSWIWPTVQSLFLAGQQLHRIFDLLVTTSHDKTVQQVLIDGIRESWDAAENGVIIGGLDFSRVGENPLSNYDPIGAVHRVAEELGVPDPNVTIVLTYNNPLDHWHALWTKHFNGHDYKKLICSDHQADKRFEFLDTIMFPLKVASKYIEEGWRVAVIDEKGTWSDGKDVAHVLACNLMDGVQCQDEWVIDLEDDIVTHPTLVQKPDYLSAKNLRELEQYLKFRDCYFKFTLENDIMFTVLHQEDLWDICSPDHGAEAYEPLVDTNVFIDLLRKQQGCSTGLSAGILGALAADNAIADSGSEILDEINLEDGDTLGSYDAVESNLEEKGLVIAAITLPLVIIVLLVLSYYVRKLKFRLVRRMRKGEPSDGLLIKNGKTNYRESMVSSVFATGESDTVKHPEVQRKEQNLAPVNTESLETDDTWSSNHTTTFFSRPKTSLLENDLSSRSDEDESIGSDGECFHDIETGGEEDAAKTEDMQNSTDHMEAVDEKEALNAGEIQKYSYAS